MRKYLTLRGSLIVLNVLVLFAVALIWPKLTNQPAALSQSAPTPTITNPVIPTTTVLQVSSPTILPTKTSIPSTPEPATLVVNDTYTQSGFNPIVFSLVDNGYAHLFMYDPHSLPFARLTSNPWDDIHPALSPDSTRLAFSSRRNAYWDLYVLDLASGALTRLTDTLAYDGNPAWSPDGSWIAYETYQTGNLDIAILSVTDPSAPPIYLTDSPASEISPAWSPQGRHIAFVSNQEGNADIWVADLDAESDRLTNLTPSSPVDDSHPTWSPDGSLIAYSTRRDEVSQIAVLEFPATRAASFLVGMGNWPAWSADGSAIATLVNQPNQIHLAVYRIANGVLVLPFQNLTTGVQGLSWAGAGFPGVNLSASEPIQTSVSQIANLNQATNGRIKVAPLDGVAAPQAYLNESVIPAFDLLRSRVALESGWDFFATLENAYVPITSPLPPGMGSDWLYTGRAIAFSTAPLGSGWIVLGREDISGLTYWRVFLKTRFQDGSQGQPLNSSTWDLNARYNGDPVAYDQGGKVIQSIPEGYWLDLTELAGRFGWLQVPALSTWRTLFNGARFNELVFPGGLQWEQAMLELYPPEVLLTPTQAATITRTPTRVPTWYKTRTPTLTSTPTITPSARPTWTPPAGTTCIGG